MPETVELKRSLSLLQLSFYGLGTILGAGIYVLIGAVASSAGINTPLAFIVAAGVASLTALTYAELSVRMPVSAAEAMYIDAAFGRRALTLATGLAVVLVGTISAATIANGFAAYLQVFVALPRDLAVLGVLVALGTIAAVGIQASVWVATLITVIEVAGLVLVIALAGGELWSPTALAALMPPGDAVTWRGIGLGAVVAFYAFIGFEDMVNVAEEVRDPERNLPRAIIIALVASSVLYVLVALTAVTAVPLESLAGSEAPLAVIVAAHGLDPRIIAGVSLLAVVNGALIQIVMASRILFGLARQGRLPTALSVVHPRTRTPLLATALVTVLVMSFAVALPLVRLATVTSVITLLIFAAVNAALIVLRARERAPVSATRYPLWVPYAGFILSLLLVATQLLF